MEADGPEPGGTGFDEDFVAAATIKEPPATGRKTGVYARWRIRRMRRKFRTELDRRPPRRRRRFLRRRRPSGDWSLGAWVRAIALVGSLVGVAVLMSGRHIPGVPDLGADPHPADTTPVSPLPSEINPGAPFAGTPAASYADGADGIQLPQATPLAGFSTREVKNALDRTRALLIAADLDPGTLFSGDTESFSGNLDPGQKSDFIKSLSAKNPDDNQRSFLVDFAPGDAELTGTIIKVKGQMTLGTATHQGLRGVTVTVNYLFVYPVHRPGDLGTTMRIVVHRTGQVFLFRDSAGDHTWLSAWSGPAAGGRCDVRDAYVHPDYPESAPDKVQPSGAPLDPYALDQTPAPGSGCGQTTGT